MIIKGLNNICEIFRVIIYYYVFFKNLNLKCVEYFSFFKGGYDMVV